MRKKLSFVVPVYNEQDNLIVFYENLKKTIKRVSEEYESEILFINDGSNDSSWGLIRDLVHQDSCVRGITFTKNFGHQIALTAGYDHAQGDVVISLDADLQHPPHIITCMIKKWEEGYPVVYARRKTTQEGFLKKWVSRLYVWALSFVSGQTFPQGVADFRLVDKAVVQELRMCEERFRYLRGAIVSLGYPFAFVEYDQPSRFQGTSKYTFYKMLSLGFNGLICFSTLPLRFLCYCGFFIVLIGFLTTVSIFFKIFFLEKVQHLYAFCFLVLYLLLAIIFLMLWIMSEYLIRMYEVQNRRQPYVIMQQVGFKKFEKDFE